MKDSFAQSQNETRLPNRSISGKYNFIHPLWGALRYLWSNRLQHKESRCYKGIYCVVTRILKQRVRLSNAYFRGSSSQNVLKYANTSVFLQPKNYGIKENPTHLMGNAWIDFFGSATEWFRKYLVFVSWLSLKSGDILNLWGSNLRNLQFSMLPRL